MGGGQLIALEREAHCTQRLVDSQVLPADSVITGDGISFLQEGRQKFDLVTAFMLGPDIDGDFSARFLCAARNSLNPGGQVLVCSEIATMSAVRRVCTSQNFSFRWIEGVPADIPVPSTAVVSYTPVETDREVSSFARFPSLVSFGSLPGEGALSMYSLPKTPSPFASKLFYPEIMALLKDLMNKNRP